RVSVQHLLDAVELKHSPSPHDGWLLVPGDHPLVNAATLQRLIDEWHQHPSSIVLPIEGGRRGHPTIFPWPLAGRARDLPPGAGVNHLLHDGETPIIEVPIDDPTIHLDLDTPEDYQQALTLVSG